MDYLKQMVPSQLVSDRGSKIVVINPGSENIRIGVASWQAPFVVPHCIAVRMKGSMDEKTQLEKEKWEQVYKCPVSPSREREREDAYDAIKMYFDVESPEYERDNESWYRKPDDSEDTSFSWTEMKEVNSSNPSTTATTVHHQADVQTSEANAEGIDEVASSKIPESSISDFTFRKVIFGDEALRIAPDQPYVIRHPIRRGHFNLTEYYSMSQICDDLYRMWDWILIEKLRISAKDRDAFSAVLVVSETFDNREIKEMLTVILRDLQFSSAVIHQESVAATFGNGVSSACVVNIGAQVISILCTEDGVAMPTTRVTLPFGGEDISRCLLWLQRSNQTWPPIDTDPMEKPIDMLMLNRLKETYCKIQEGYLTAEADVCCFKASSPMELYRVSLSYLNVPPMGLFYPSILMPDEYPCPPTPSWYHDHEDMLEDSSHSEFSRRPDGAEIYFPGSNYGLFTQDPSESRNMNLRKEDNLVGLADAITNSILSSGRVELYRKLFTSILLVGGVASTKELVGAVEDRLLQAIPENVDVETVEVMQLRADPQIIVWKGGAVLGFLDYSREGWIHRENWVNGGVNVGNGQKLKDSVLIQTQTLWYINS